MGEFRKALAAVLGAFATWGATAAVADGRVDSGEWWGLAVAVAAAFAVWLVPNDPPDFPA